MRFIVSRTSEWDEEVCPISGATREVIDYYDRRTFKSFEEYEQKLKHSFLDKGTDHKNLPGGGIQRTLPRNRTVWLIDLTYEQLLEFIALNGEVVIHRDYNNEDYYHLEIYDDYRE